MAKSMYDYIKDSWKKPQETGEWKKRLIEWRRGNSIIRLDKPTRLDRARKLGYKAKKGFVVVRVRILRGGRKRPRRKKGRRSKRQTIHKTLQINYQWVAESRVERKFKNMVVLNSYWVAQDGINYWYEVILIDPSRPEIIVDKNLSGLLNKKGRVIRGLTSAARKSRGLR